jgi:Cu/Ag efflux pump CusA
MSLASLAGAGQRYSGGLEPRARRDVESVRELVIRNMNGSQATLGELAYIYMVAGGHVIFREGARRRQQVSFNAEGTDLESFAPKLERRIRLESACATRPR